MVQVLVQRGPTSSTGQRLLAIMAMLTLVLLGGPTGVFGIAQAFADDGEDCQTEEGCSDQCAPEPVSPTAPADDTPCTPCTPTPGGDLGDLAAQARATCSDPADPGDSGDPPDRST